MSGLTEVSFSVNQTSKVPLMGVAISDLKLPGMFKLEMFKTFFHPLCPFRGFNFQAFQNRGKILDMYNNDTRVYINSIFSQQTQGWSWLIDYQ